MSPLIIIPEYIIFIAIIYTFNNIPSVIKYGKYSTIYYTINIIFFNILHIRCIKNRNIIAEPFAKV